MKTMRRQLKKRAGNGEPTPAEEAAPAVRASMGASRKLTAAARIGRRFSERTMAVRPDHKMSYLELRNRSIVKPPIARSAADSRVRRRSNFSIVGVARFFSSVSDEESHHSCLPEFALELDEPTPRRCNGERGEMAVSIDCGDEAIDLKPAVEMRSHVSSAMKIMPSEAELEDFFAAADREVQILTERYNFDFVNEVPLPGRFEWIPSTP